MTDFIDEMFSDHELVRAFNGSGIQSGAVPDSFIAPACRVVARYAIAKYIASGTPTLERIAEAMEKLADPKVTVQRNERGEVVLVTERLQSGDDSRLMITSIQVKPS